MATVRIDVTTHVFVNVYVGPKPLSLLIDSASDTFLDKATAATLGLPPYDVAIGGARLTTFALADFSALTSAVGRRIDGILGRQLFDRYVVDLDYAHGVMRLHDPRSFRYEGAARPLALRVSGGFAMVPAQVTLGGKSANGMFALDTGANTPVTLFTPFIRRYGMGPRQLPVTISGVTLAGEGNAPVMRLDAIRLGRHFLRGPVTGLIDRRLVRLAPDRQFAGLLGNDLFRRFRMIVDYSGRRLILEPTKDLTEEFAFDRSGLQLRAKGQNLETIVVAGISTMSPASGRFQKGDVIEAIDGEPVTDLYSVRRSFEIPGTRQVTVRRGQQTIRITLVTRSLL